MYIFSCAVLYTMDAAVEMFDTVQTAFRFAPRFKMAVMVQFVCKLMQYKEAICH
ncbi:hypothetical protein CARN8_1330004 [mine drainage metagenome]|uniref:Uncharacterized protein n=1 Tax=mine drainage metagenome TaxID=410659 RepID=A0A3P3ZLI6_9ZZZZ